MKKSESRIKLNKGLTMENSHKVELTGTPLKNFFDMSWKAKGKMSESGFAELGGKNV